MCSRMHGQESMDKNYKALYISDPLISERSGDTAIRRVFRIASLCLPYYTK